MLDDAAARRTQRAETMGIVDHHPGVALPGFSTNRRQIGQVAVHAEYAIGHHQGVADGLVQTLAQAPGIVVQVARKARAAEQTGVQ